MHAQDSAARQTNSSNTSTTQQPLQVSFSVLGYVKHIGAAASVSKTFFQKEIHRNTKNGKEKKIERTRLMDLSLGYYYQNGLHQRYMLMAGYQVQRCNEKGFYRIFMPQLGISRTFLTEETYSVNESGEVKKVKAAGNWNLTAALNIGIGKKIKSNSNTSLRLNDIFARSSLWIFYPNFRSIAVKPSFQIGAGFTIPSRQFHLIKKTIYRK